MFSLGCGDELTPSSKVPWSDQTTRVLDADRNVVTLSGSTSEGACLDYQGQCLKSQDKCGELAADVVLDASGKVLDYLCYPAESTLTVEQLETKQGDIAQNENNSVIVLDELDDGVDIEGDVSVDANNVVIYGSSPDTSVISGSLTLDGNNALVRGVRLQGDVTILKNDAVLAFCVIEGNLVIEGNNAQVLACDVLGSVTIRGNNAKLHGDRIAGALTAGKNAECRDNVAFTDVDADHSVDAAELGSPLGC
jgi:hypothetical protein